MKNAGINPATSQIGALVSGQCQPITFMYMYSTTGGKTTGWKQSEGRSKILGKGEIFLAATNTLVVYF